MLIQHLSSSVSRKVEGACRMYREWSDGGVSRCVPGFIPVADRLRMSWREENQHVDWEKVAAAMFHACVRSPIQVDEGRVDGQFWIGQYDIDFESYAEASGISVRSAAHGERLAMIRLLTFDEPLDTVKGPRFDAASF